MPFFLTPNGTRVYYEQHGSSGPVLVFLHGLASSSRIWAGQVKKLKAHYQVYTLDFPGHGQSERWQHYSFDKLVELLASWMNSLEIEQAALAGMSVGCTVALAMAIRHPSRVSAVILEGPVGGYHRLWHPLGSLDWLVFKSFPLLLRLSVLVFGHQATAHWLNTFGVRRAKRNFKVLESVQQLADYRAVRQLLWESSHPPYTNQLHLVQAPTLLVRGANDPMPPRFVYYIQNHVRQCQLIEVPETRHIVSLERPRAFNRIVQEFLTSLD